MNTYITIIKGIKVELPVFSYKTNDTKKNSFLNYMTYTQM